MSGKTFTEFMDDLAYNLDYNHCRPGDQDRQLKILKALLGSCGNHVYIEDGLHMSYGKHVYLGDYFYANFNLTIWI